MGVGTYAEYQHVVATHNSPTEVLAHKNVTTNCASSISVVAMQCAVFMTAALCRQAAAQSVLYGVNTSLAQVT